MINSKMVDILLVEDNLNDAELTKHTLKKHNLCNALEWVKDGEQALDFLFRRGEYVDRCQSEPKLILLDLRMPKIDGLEVLKAVRANPKTAVIPIVIMTSSTQDQDIINSYRLGANSFVSKPVAFEEFAKVVADLGFYWVFINKSTPT